MQDAESRAHERRSDRPSWLAEWHAPVGSAEAAARFDRLAALEPDEMIGSWRGSGLATGHPFDGVLEALGWRGKAFLTRDDVQPLIFRRPSGNIIALDPGLLPVGIGLRWPRLARNGMAQAAARALLPLLGTRRPTARLRKVFFRGKLSAAMIYDRQPIIDHFRRIDGVRVLGLMDMRGNLPPYFFVLTRERGGEHSG